jgi:hypothetical protein
MNGEKYIHYVQFNTSMLPNQVFCIEIYSNNKTLFNSELKKGIIDRLKENGVRNYDYGISNISSLLNK